MTWVGQTWDVMAVTFINPRIFDKLASEGMRFTDAYSNMHGLFTHKGQYGAPQLREEGCEGYFSPYCNPKLQDGPPGEYLTERLAEEAMNFIDNMKGKKQPFTPS